MRQLELPFKEYETKQLFLFGDKVSEEERERAIQEAQEEAEEILSFDNLKKLFYNN